MFPNTNDISLIETLVEETDRVMKTLLRCLPTNLNNDPVAPALPAFHSRLFVFQLFCDTMGVFV